jgi:hypothetical protein
MKEAAGYISRLFCWPSQVLPITTSPFILFSFKLVLLVVVQKTTSKLILFTLLPMKNLFVLVFILITKIAIAQNQDTVGLHTPFINGEVVYQQVFNAPNKSEAQLFSNTQLWFIKHYRNLKSIQINDEVTGRIVGRGAELLTFKTVLGMEETYMVNMTIQIDYKNSRYRTRIFNIVIEKEDSNKVKSFIDVEQLMNDLVGIKNNDILLKNINPFNKNQSKRALQSLNVLVNNVMWSIDKTMNETDNF